MATIRQLDPVPWLWPMLLLLVAFYLIALGIVGLVRPATAVGFLSGFAQTTQANVTEVIARSLVGLALIGMAPMWQSMAAVAAGLFLVITALAMLAFPHFHRRLAARSVASIAGSVRYVGVASLALGCALIVLLAKTAY